MMVTIEADSKFPDLVRGYIPVAEGFDKSKPTTIKAGGIGTVSFNEEATASIIKNAGDADNIFFSFENVTAQLSIDADKVIEITMNTAGENGGAVFSEINASGEVTIKIPLSENVRYVESVTLVDSEGKSIEDGVVPDSEYFDKENGILSFKVNHFSKYAIDYVTQDEFVAVTGVSLDTTSAELKVGDTLRLKATIAPDNATNKKMTWSSSDTTKVAVDNTGKITAKAAGTATVTVTTEDGVKTATCTVTVKDDTSSGALKGVFSVSATKKVQFSQGNLTYNVTDKKWAFYENQYDCATGYDSNLISLFTWGYNAEKSIVPNGNNSDNVSRTSGNLTQDEDWGCTIGDGKSWRTLTIDEWCYLFAFNQNAQDFDYKTERFTDLYITTSPRYGLFRSCVTVCGHNNCIVLLPDDWKWGGAVGDGWQTTYSEETSVKWSAMEAAGAVCLPAAGTRNFGNSLNDVGGKGYYWSSTTPKASWANCLYFDNTLPEDLSLSGQTQRQIGLSVRLVTDVPAAK